MSREVIFSLNIMAIYLKNLCYQLDYCFQIMNFKAHLTWEFFFLFQLKNNINNFNMMNTYFFKIALA